MSYPVFSPKPQLDHDRVKAALKEFYSIHNASRMSSIDTIVESYFGKEVELLDELKKRYKVEFEPFDKIITEYKASFPGGIPPPEVPQSPDSSTSDRDPSNMSSSSSTSSAAAAASRGLAGLGLSTIPNIFTDKLMNGVNWKGFTLDPSVLGASTAAAVDSKKDTEVAEETVAIDFVALAKETGHPSELLMELHRAIEINTAMEKQLFQTLRRLDMRTINAATAKPTSSSKKASSVNDRTTDPADVLSSLFTGRSEDSLKAEICELRDLVDCMRDFVVESAKRPVRRKESPTDSNEVPNQTEASEISQESSAPEEPAEKTVQPEPERSFVVDSTSLQQLESMKSSLTINWKEQDELRLQINELKAETTLLKQAIVERDALLNSRDDTICALQLEIKELREQLVVSQRSKVELIEINDAKLRDMEQQCREQIMVMEEQCLLEREDALGQLASVAEVQQNWQAALSQEAQTEIVRLRVELAKARRQESQREREVAFLQRQLTEAAKQLAQYVVDSEDVDGSHE